MSHQGRGHLNTNYLHCILSVTLSNPDKHYYYQVALMSPPPAEIIEAFGNEGQPKPVAGGRGLCYEVDGIVFKPSDGDDEAQWISELATNLLDRSPSSYRLARPLAVLGQPGEFVYRGWTASTFVSGMAISKSGTGSTSPYETIFRASRAFHADVADLIREKPPAITHAISNRWREADKVTWGEKTLDQVDNVSTETLALFQPLLDRLILAKKPFPEDEPISQLIHADLTGNVLHGDEPGMAPAIIDLTPFWRPAAYAEAIVVSDGLAWCGAGRELVELYGTDEVRAQLLVRAMYWRCLTFAIDPDTAWIKENLPRANYEGAVRIMCDVLGL